MEGEIMQFNPSLDWGSLLNAFVLLVGFVVAFTRIGGRIDLMAQRLKAVEETLKDQRSNNTRLSILEERVTNNSKMLTVAQQEIADLRRGSGFITSARKTIDGSY